MKKLALSATLFLTILASVACTSPSQQEINKQNVVDFYNQALNEKNFEAASKYIGSRYTQHNPKAADGPEGFKGFIEFLRSHHPESRSENQASICRW